MNTETLKMELATARKAEGQAWAAAIAAESGAGGLRRNRMPENMEPILAGVHDHALVQRIGVSDHETQAQAPEVPGRRQADTYLGMMNPAVRALRAAATDATHNAERIAAQLYRSELPTD